MDEAPLNTIIGLSKVHFNGHETDSPFFIVQGMDQLLGDKNIGQTPRPWDKSKLGRGDKSIKKWSDEAN